MPLKRRKAMYKVKITVMRIVVHKDLISKYENPILHACFLKEGDVFIYDGYNKPNNLCDSAWETLYPFVKELSLGKGNFFDGWMKNDKSAMISCNDGFRPVSFYLETIE